MTPKATAVELVGDLLAGTSVRSVCACLGSCGQAGVDTLLDALEGSFGNAPRNRDSREVHEDLLAGLQALATVDPLPLIRTLETRPQHAQALILALGSSRDETAVNTLMEHATHRDPWVRWAAITGLVRQRKKSLLPTLLAALRDRSGMVSYAALVGLPRVADKTAIKPLKRYLTRKRLGLGARRHASELLARLEGS